MVQNRNNIVKALASADRELIIIAAFVTSLPANNVKNLEISIKRGAPGGWPTCSLYALAINSPQSHRLVVGSIVDRYTNAAIRKVIHPVILLYNVYFFSIRHRFYYQGK